jgi:beta-lactamase superfamily II metal-dependent hydrolase
MHRNSKKNYLFTIFLLLLAFVAILFWTEYRSSEKLLTISVLDVGQGDAILIESPTGTQVLFDAGPPNKILSQLAKVMSPTDRSLDMIFLTHPDQDHIGGILDVLENYTVSYIFESGTSSDSQTFKNFKNLVKEKNIKDVLAKKGTRIDLGAGAYLEILFPDRDVSSWETNAGSIVARVVYGENSVMLTGDAPVETENIILSENSPESLQSDILKLGHHGSKTSTSSDFLKAVNPDYGIISVGLNNKYKHPSTNILSSLTNFGVQVFRTDQDGIIEVKLDGKDEDINFGK